ncbi:MAG: hypothetical protein IT303_04175, partial [Dehalococcoidia bacterium]|nr:hypothetical protein [Dehalococcoidia bacterium]
QGWSLTQGVVECPAEPANTGEISVTIDSNWTHIICLYNEYEAVTGTANNVIAKYVNGALATEGTFNFIATYDDHAGMQAIDEPFMLDSTNGFMITGSELQAGFDYSFSEVDIDADCSDEGDVYRLLGYSMSTVSLEDAASMTPAMVSSWTDVQQDQYIVVHNQRCDFQEVLGSITVVKHVGDADMTDAAGVDFEFTMTDEDNFFLDVDSDADAYTSSQTFMDLEAGLYTVGELVSGGWELDHVSCDGGANQRLAPVANADAVDINLGAGANVTCHFYNVMPGGEEGTGTIRIVKEADGADTEIFGFNIFSERGETDFSEDFDLDLDTANSDRESFRMMTDLPAGAYEVTEDAMAGWAVESVTCTPAGVSTWASGVLTIELEADADVVCTFINRTSVTGTEFPIFVPQPSENLPDTGSDNGTDTGTDSGSDNGSDTGSDTGTDTGTDNGSDTGTDTGTDTGADNGNDNGTGETPVANNDAVAGVEAPEGAGGMTGNGATNNDAVAGVQAPGAPDTGSGSALGGSRDGMPFIIAGLIAMMAGLAYFGVRRA